MRKPRAGDIIIPVGNKNAAYRVVSTDYTDGWFKLIALDVDKDDFHDHGDFLWPSDGKITTLACI